MIKIMQFTAKIKKTKFGQSAKGIRRLITQLQRLSYLENGKISYSQFGEDLLVDTVLTRLGINEPTYLDIGAHHSRHLSNTFFFYSKGSHGVCVEPNPVLCEEIKANRKRDICVGAGVGFDDATAADFYVMKEPALSTFSKEEAEHIQQVTPNVLEKVIKLPLVSINQILRQYFDTCPDFVSVDVEGLDLAILRSLDFSLYRPAVFCVETIEYTPGREINKRHDIIQFMSDKQYFVYADTSINSIFVDSHRWFDSSD
jgi:FkbM family methyltransferase